MSRRKVAEKVFGKGCREREGRRTETYTPDNRGRNKMDKEARAIGGLYVGVNGARYVRRTMVGRIMEWDQVWQGSKQTSR